MNSYRQCLICVLVVVFEGLVETRGLVDCPQEDWVNKVAFNDGSLEGSFGVSFVVGVVVVVSAMASIRGIASS